MITKLDERTIYVTETPMMPTLPDKPEPTAAEREAAWKADRYTGAPLTFHRRTDVDTLTQALEHARAEHDAQSQRIRAGLDEAADAIAITAGELLDAVDLLAVATESDQLSRASDVARESFGRIAQRLRAVARQV